MFSYNTPKLNIRISTKQLSFFFTAVFVLSIIPMLILGFFDWPSADDYSMALQPHLYFLETGNVFGTIQEVFKKSWWIYSQYEGYFFSIILTCICPSIFGESFYVVTPFIIMGMLTFGVMYFFDALMVKTWKLDYYLSRVAAIVTLLLMIQCLPKDGLRVEAFYWYSGAINYTFTFGMAFFWLGLLMRTVYEPDEKARKRKLFWACFWGFWLGGANYMTALQLGICSVLVIVIFFMIKKGSFKLEGATKDQEKSAGYIWLPALLNLIGFACSCFTPGNLTRSSETEHIGAVKSVLLSLYSTLDMMFNEMLRWETIVLLVLLVPVFWKMAQKMQQKLQHPVLFTLFAYLLVSSNVTPPFFAVGNLGAGRLKALAWMEFVIMLVLVVFYLTVWGRTKIEERYGIRGSTEPQGDKLTVEGSGLIIACLVILLFGSALCAKPEMDYYSTTSAITDLVSGSAATFRKENRERLIVLKDDSIKDAELMEHTAQPEMLYYWDVTTDPSEWVNGATAKYYYKDSVVLKKAYE